MATIVPSRATQRRQVNEQLAKAGGKPLSRAVAKGILDRWRAMSTDERADEFNLRAAGVPPDVARALAMTGNGKAPKRKPKFGGLISKMGPTLAETGMAGHTTGLTGSQALRGAVWRKRRRKRIDKAADAIIAAVLKAGDFDESKHPRADDGEFGSGSGSRGTTDNKPAATPKTLSDEKATEALSNPKKVTSGATKPGTEKNHPSNGKPATKEEIEAAVRDYTNFGYFSMNEQARNYDLSKPKTKQDKRDRRHAEALSQAINSQPLAKDTTLYRGFAVAPGLKIGDTVENHGFTSASLSKSVANRFAKKAAGGNKESVLATIRAPKGTPALDVSTHAGASQDNTEKEFVFDHRTRFRVVEDSGKNSKGHRQLVLEPVTPHPGTALDSNTSKKKTSAAIRSQVTKRHMVSQIASQAIAAAYEPPRLPANASQYTDPPEFARYLDAQRLVAGMDEELSVDPTQTPQQARARASRALATSMGHYDRTIAGPDRALAHVGGLNLDLGSGQARERGFLGVDTFPFDYGTVVADLGMGIPFPDGSARAVRLVDALHEMPDYATDATPLMLEVQRVLGIGGRFVYRGPPLQDIVNWSKLPGLGVVGHQFSDGGKTLSLTLQRQSARLPIVFGADTNHLFAPETDAADGQLQAARDQFGDLPPASVAMANLVAKKEHVDVRASIVAKRDYDRVCLGVVLAPNIVDSQGDFMTAADIEATAHDFLANARVVGREHSDIWEGGEVVESYIAPTDLNFADPTYGPQMVPKGSWILGVRLPPDSFGDVLEGKVTGFSVGGWGEREEAQAPNAVAPTAAPSVI